MSEHTAFVFGETSKQPGVETEYVDIRTLKIWTSDADEAVKDHRLPRSFPAPTMSCLLCRNTITVFPGCSSTSSIPTKNTSSHKEVGICGVSAGGFGGTRVLLGLLPVLRELGLIST